jgi:hypothetical protein
MNQLVGWLKSQGYVVKQNATIYKDKQVDLLATKGDKTLAIEVKTGQANLFDALSTISTIKSSPDVDEAVLAIPRDAFNEDLSYLASILGVGIYGVSERGVDVLVAPRGESTQLSVSTTIPGEIPSGSYFRFGLHVQNYGGKTLLDVVVSYFPTEIIVPRGLTSANMGEVPPGLSRSTNFDAAVASGVKPGYYPILFKITAYRTPPHRGVIQVKVI